MELAALLLISVLLVITAVYAAGIRSDALAYKRRAEDILKILRKYRKELSHTRGKLQKLECSLSLHKKISDEALTRAMDAHVRVGAIEKSTHTIHPVPVATPGAGNFEVETA